MRLIYADALRDKWEHDIGVFFAKDIVTSIDDAPTIDAVPVVHGEWKKASKRLAYCSICNDLWSFEQENEVKALKYCPNCGARMDGERREG